MGKSTNPCLKIITCGSGSAEDDDGELLPPLIKTSSEKRRWSFRKKSVSRPVPNNTVISEPQFVGYDKANSEATANDFYVAKDASVPEKKPIIELANETAPLSSTVANPEVTAEVETGTITTVIDASLRENVAIVIQAAIRRFLALRELQKHKKVIKLQAVVRGHLVRREAIGSLRCVQAIVKMQVLIRAHLARQAMEKCAMQEKLDDNIQMDSQLSSVLVKRNSALKSDKTMGKLLSNGFARQLLDSKSKTKPIHISCDPLKPDSAWQWLERWMAVTSSNVGQQCHHNRNQGYQEEDGKSEHIKFEEINGIPVIPTPALPDSNLSGSKSAPAEDKEDSPTVTSGKVEFQVQASDPGRCVNLSAKDETEQSQGEEGATKKDNIDETERAEITSNPVSSQSKIDATSLSEFDNNPSKLDVVTENLKCTAMTAPSDPVENEGKKLETGLKKLRNSAFAAVQAKFEELSSAPKAIRSVSYVSRDATVEPKQTYSQLDSMTNSEGVSPKQATQNPVINVAASECGTEISISSTLDSPDQSEADGGEIILELGTLEGRRDVHNGGTDAFNFEGIDKAKEPSVDSSVFQQEHDENDRNISNSISAFESVQQKEQQTELRTSSIQIQQDNLKDSHANDRSSPERFPMSHVNVSDSYGTPSSHVNAVELDGTPSNYVTGAESDGTPSSQVTVSSRTRKKEKKTATGKPKSKLVSKSSPSNLKNDSAERSSAEHLPKDVNNAKKRSSLGIAKPENSDNEPRLSCSSALPSYMQATQSARAKAQGSLSLKTSPDVQDKDNHIKKRHSLPISDDKQGSSPRVQRSASQTQQSLKSNGTHSPHTSAERRWQR
ncbi:protein IQ-DOMAIN 32 [Iris pallida]|uniref:Protein IQ-DOMAIN 32 n=2 Tax=Iris pallida TaxID=29817 RepID=A0AAX6IEA8_IRIPA|nr:protein IQ-DOMAIN 32 [Iris pallida]